MAIILFIMIRINVEALPSVKQQEYRLFLIITYSAPRTAQFHQVGMQFTIFGKSNSKKLF
jgi:hypothetical protein